MIDINHKIKKYINQYDQMRIKDLIIHCPYWSNKLVDGKVVMRGFLDGKGSALDIRNELSRKIKDGKITSQLEMIQLARRERIGIDCSGFVFRLLDYLVRLGYQNSNIKNLDEIFKGGISKTNADKLTSLQYCNKIKEITQIAIGDLIRLNKGHHVVFIMDVNKGKITYAHSSKKLTQVQGVHLGEIEIQDKYKTLDAQNWLEKTPDKQKINSQYFFENFSDGVYRLKIFQHD